MHIKRMPLLYFENRQRSYPSEKTQSQRKYHKEQQMWNAIAYLQWNISTVNPIILKNPCVCRFSAIHSLN